MGREARERPEAGGVRCRSRAGTGGREGISIVGERVCRMIRGDGGGVIGMGVDLGKPE